jgi:hypothetical protein
VTTAGRQVGCRVPRLADCYRGNRRLARPGAYLAASPSEEATSNENHDRAP